MKLRFLIFLMLMTVAVLLLSSCHADDTTAAVPNETTEEAASTSTIAEQVSTTPAPVVIKLTPAEAKKMIDEGTVIILDVRRTDEYAQGHIPGAILLPNETLQETAEATLTDKNAVILVYCRSGRRSAEAADKLISLGYTKVYDFGGILDWPYETTK